MRDDRFEAGPELSDPRVVSADLCEVLFSHFECFVVWCLPIRHESQLIPESHVSAGMGVSSARTRESWQGESAGSEKFFLHTSVQGSASSYQFLASNSKTLN